MSWQAGTKFSGMTKSHQCSPVLSRCLNHTTNSSLQTLIKFSLSGSWLIFHLLQPAENHSSVWASLQRLIPSLTCDWSAAGHSAGHPPWWAWRAGWGIHQPPGWSGGSWLLEDTSCSARRRSVRSQKHLPVSKNKTRVCMRGMAREWGCHWGFCVLPVRIKDKSDAGIIAWRNWNWTLKEAAMTHKGAQLLNLPKKVVREIKGIKSTSFISCFYFSLLLQQQHRPFISSGWIHL